jgi:hypothetical protein
MNLFDRFLVNRKIFGLSFLLFGGPIIYFFRDGLAIAPASSAFTGACNVLCIFIMTPLSQFQRLFKPNKLLYYLCFFYLSIAVIYLFVYVANDAFTNTPLELINYLLLLCLFVFLLTVSETSFEEKFLKTTFYISCLGSILLVLYSIKNGYTFGARASIQFAKGSKEMAAAGNPHIYSRTAFALFFSAMMLIRNGGIWRILGIGGVLLGFVVLAMTQTFAAFLALFLAGIVYILARYSIKKVLFRIFDFFFGVRGLSILIGMIGFIYYLINFTSLSRYYDRMAMIFERRIGGIINLLFKNPELLKKAAKFSKIPIIDSSANTRVENITKMFENFGKSLETNPLPVIFGYGYQQFYVDSPVFEAWNDMGIFSFLLYLSIVIITTATAFRTIKYNYTPTRQFTAYFMLLLVVHSFTFGMPYGTYLWFYFAFAARFLRVR